jgi:sugar lactone lactonase YvrE
MSRLVFACLVFTCVAHPSAQSQPPATGARDTTPVATGTVAITLADPELIPESVAFDTADGSFYVGSMYKRKIVRVAKDGTVSDFITTGQDGIWTVLGIKVDSKRRELLANACNLADRRPPMMPDDEPNRGKAGLFRYDLRTGRLLAKYIVGNKDQPRCFNDLVITPDGHAFMSTGPDGIYRARAESMHAELFAPYEGFVNGIAASDDGTKLFLADHQGGVHVMDLATRTAKRIAVPEGESLQAMASTSADARSSRCSPGSARVRASCRRS